MTYEFKEKNNQNNWMRTFLFIWTGQAFSLLGSGLVQFALVWWLTQTTQSALVLATATLVSLLPQVFLGPFAGALVDRWNRKLVMMLADGIIAVFTLGLGVLFATGAIQLWHVYVVLFIRAVGGSFHFPAMEASTSLLVPEKQLSRVAGMNQTIRGILNIAAPPLGAFLMTVLPIFTIVLIDVVTAVLAITPLFFITIPQPRHDHSGEVITPRVLLRDVKDGLKYVLSWPGLFAVLLMATVLNFFFVPIDTLMPLLVTRHFHGDAMALGIMSSAWGLGVVGGALILTAWGGFKKRILTTLLGIVGIGLGAIITGLAPANAFLLGVFGMVLAGFMNPITNGPLMALVQARVAPNMQGRVFTLINSAAGAMMPLGTMISAPVADGLGIQTWFWITGLVCILMAAIALMMPVITRIEDQKTTLSAVQPIPAMDLIE